MSPTTATAATNIEVTFSGSRCCTPSPQNLTKDAINGLAGQIGEAQSATLIVTIKDNKEDRPFHDKQRTYQLNKDVSPASKCVREKVRILLQETEEGVQQDDGFNGKLFLCAKEQVEKRLNSHLGSRAGRAQTTAIVNNGDIKQIDKPARRGERTYLLSSNSNSNSSSPSSTRHGFTAAETD
ncbi:MAG: hypothetical protein ACPGUD_09480 [Parashewanella sp.]